MQLEDIYQYFANPPEIYLCQEQAVCYILSVLLEGESYGSGLIQKLEREESRYRLSDTVLYAALKFLEDEGAIAGYWQKLEGRGRPRRSLSGTRGERRGAGVAGARSPPPAPASSSSACAAHCRSRRRLTRSRTVPRPAGGPEPEAPC